MVRQSAHEAVARLAPFARAQRTIEAEAGDLVDIAACRNLAVDEIGIEIAKYMRLGRLEQAGRGRVALAAVGDDEVGRIGIVEMIDLPGPGQDRHVPLRRGQIIARGVSLIG